MRVGADAASIARAGRAPDPGDDADRDAAVVQHRPLLDMQFQIAFIFASRQQFALVAGGIRIESGLTHMRGQRAIALHVDRRLQFSRLQHPQHSTAAKMAAVVPAVPAARLFSANAHDRDIGSRHESRTAHGGQRGHSGNDARGAIIVAAIGHRIQMRTRNPARQRPVASRQRQIQIAGKIHRNLKRKRGGRGRHLIVRILLTRAVRLAAHTFLCRRMGAQISEKPLGEHHGTIYRGRQLIKLS